MWENTDQNNSEYGHFSRSDSLADASRNLYLSVKANSKKIGIKTSKYDSAVFYYCVKNELQGALIAHVDDTCWGENQTFVENIISPIKKIFNVGSKSFSTASDNLPLFILIFSFALIYDISPCSTSVKARD